MKKYFLLIFCLWVGAAYADDRSRNDGGKKDETMETKSTADHSGQKMGPSEPNPEGKKKSFEKGPRTMQNTIPGTNQSPPPANR